MLLRDLKLFSTVAFAISESAKQAQRNFGFLSLLGFSCTVLVTWEGTLL